VYSGNFTNIPTANKMATYCGIASFRCTSGTSINYRQDVGHLSNRRLKGVLTMAARCAIRYDDSIRQYYQRKTAQGKLHGVAINNVKNKLLHIAYALVKNDCDYDPSHVNCWQGD
jgi:transposase